jgi:hypothetical protein
MSGMCYLGGGFKMKERVGSFLKPRFWTVFLALILVAWQYVYAFRGIDLELLAKIRTYFGFGLQAINWNDFLIRTLSMAAIWVFVALIIFLLLWLAETYVIGSHNRKIQRQYVNRPQEDFNHLLKSSSHSLSGRLISVLWFSTFIILIPIGLFMLAGLFEALRSNAVITYILAAQENGMEVDYYSLNLVIISFLATLPFWYLFSCFDTFCYMQSRKEKSVQKIENDHYAVPVIDPASFAEEAETADDTEVESQDVKNDSNIPPSPVI